MLKNTTAITPSKTSYLDTTYTLNIGKKNGAVRISVYDNREDFNFKTVNFPYLDSNIPRSPVYGVYISQLGRYARICSRKDVFIYRHRRLSLKLQQQGFKYQQLMKSFHKFYGKLLSRVGEDWNNVDITIIFGLTAGAHRTSCLYNCIVFWRKF